jgi:hypothetical protein
MNRIAPFVLLLAGVLTACQQSHKPAASPMSDMTSLAGAWRVTAVDGVTLEYPLAFGADNKRLWWEPACAGQSRSYRTDGEMITIFPYVDPSVSADGLVTICTIGPPPNLPVAFEAFDAANRISRGRENQITMSGNGRSITLVVTPGTRHE